MHRGPPNRNGCPLQQGMTSTLRPEAAVAGHRRCESWRRRARPSASAGRSPRPARGPASAAERARPRPRRRGAATREGDRAAEAGGRPSHMRCVRRAIGLHFAPSLGLPIDTAVIDSPTDRLIEETRFFWERGTEESDSSPLNNRRKP